MQKKLTNEEMLRVAILCDARAAGKPDRQPDAMDFLEAPRPAALRAKLGQYGIDPDNFEGIPLKPAGER